MGSSAKWIRAIAPVPVSRGERAAVRALIGGFLVSVTLFGFVFFARTKNGGALTVSFFDVGQGDAILIETPDGQDILVDGGPDRRIVEKLGQALPFFDRDLDLVILTHPHADHVTGLLDVLGRYRVSRVLEAGTEHDSRTFGAWREAVEREGAAVDRGRVGLRYDFSASVSLVVLWPRTEADAHADDLNADSIVLLLTAGERRFLFMGDAPEEVETAIVGALPDVDVLKAGHHGSRTSTGEAFLTQAKPEIGIISSGAGNRYGHPHAETLDRLVLFGVSVFRTDERGDVSVKTDGRNLIVRSER